MAVDYYVLAAPIVITSANATIRVEENSAAFTIDAELTAGTYYAYGAGSEATDICEQIADALTSESTASGAGLTYTCTYVANVNAGEPTGRFVIGSSGTDIKILWSHANTTFDSYIVGFAAVDTSKAAQLTSDLSGRYTWCSDQPPTVLDPRSLSGTVHQMRTQEGQTHTFRSSEPVKTRDLEFAFVDDYRVWTDGPSAAASDTYAPFETFWAERLINGEAIRLYKESISGSGFLNSLSSADLVDTYVLTGPLSEWAPVRDSDSPTYAWSLSLRKYVA